MKCQCPACGRHTWVPQEQLDFLVRCDGCRTLLLTRSSGNAAPNDGEPAVEGLSLTEVVHNLRETSGPSAGPDFSTIRRPAALRPVKPPASNRHRAGLATWSMLIISALILTIAAIILLTRIHPATARADMQRTAVPLAPHRATVIPPRPVKIQPPQPAPAPQTVDTSTGDGELFPDIPARK